MFNHLNADELWLAFGTKSHFRYIPINEIVAGLDPRICTTLPVFHALTQSLHLEEEAKGQPGIHGSISRCYSGF